MNLSKKELDSKATIEKLSHRWNPVDPMAIFLEHVDACRKTKYGENTKSSFFSWGNMIQYYIYIYIYIYMNYVYIYILLFHHNQ